MTDNVTFAPAAGFTVKPFSGPNYHRNMARCHDVETPCAICGKPVGDEVGAVMALVIDGGAAWGDPDNYNPNDGGFMGFYPVGARCARRYRVKS